MNKKEMEQKQREEFREYMVKRIERRRFNQEFFTEMYELVKTQIMAGKPMSIARMILISNMDRRSFYDAKNGKFDDSLAMYLYKENISEDEGEIVDGLPMYKGVILLPASEIIDRLYLMYEMQVTEEMMSAKNMPQVTSRIFLEKSVFGYSDQPNVVNQTNVLQITDKDFELAERLLDG